MRHSRGLSQAAIFGVSFFLGAAFSLQQGRLASAPPLRVKLQMSGNPMSAFDPKRTFVIH
jgi:hypothetical protein